MTKPSDGVVVRYANPADLVSLVSFQQAMAKETEGNILEPEQLERGVQAVFRSPGEGVYVVAEVEGHVVGGLLITYEWSDWRNATFWWIQSVYVDPRWRRKGVYRAMHEYLSTLATTSEGVCGIRLYVDRNNHIAQQAYSRLGMIKSHYGMYEITCPLAGNRHPRAVV